MRKPTKIRNIWLMLTVAAGCWLSSCTPPVLEQIIPDAAQGDQNHEVRLQVSFVNHGLADFSPKDTYGLLIDGNFSSGSGVRLDGPLRFVDDSYENGLPIPNHLEGDLIISANPVGGARELAIANSSGISASQAFLVQCAGCPPPPRFADEFNSVEPRNLVQGAAMIVRLRGHHFIDPNNPSILPSILIETGTGLSVGQNALSLSTDGVDEVIDVPIALAADASTGFHEFRVVTRGGQSARQYINVTAPPPPPLIITDATIAGGGCGPNDAPLDIFIKGENFSAQITRVDYSELSGTDEISGAVVNWFTVDDSHTVHAHMNRGHIRIESTGFRVLLYSNIPNGSATFDKQCDGSGPSPTPTLTPSPTPTPTPSPTPSPTPTPTPAGPPVLSFVTPDHVTKGTDVFIKCDGNNFSSNGLSTGRIVVTTPVISMTTLPTVQADPGKVAVARLNIAAGMTGPITIQVQDVATGQKSNPIPLQLDDPPMPTGVPYITKLVSLTGGDITPLRRNFTTNGKTNTGSFNLADSTGWITSAVPGVTFTSTVYNNSTGVLSFQVTANGSAPYSGDEATNVIRTTLGKGDGNPVALPINP